MNTHSKYGDRRMEILAVAWQKPGIQKKTLWRFALNRRREEVIGQILSMNTTTQAAILSAQGLLTSVMKTVTGRIKSVLESRFQIETEVIVFSGSAGILGMTEGAEAFAKRLKGRI